MRNISENRWLYRRCAPLSLHDPIEFVRGDSVWLFDAGGRRYLDAFHHSAHVGHANPDVLEVLRQGNGRLHVALERNNGETSRYARQLSATLHEALNVVHFCSSGTEAMDFALRVAGAYTNARGVIVGRFSCHKDGFGPTPPWLRTVSFAPEILERQFESEMETQLNALDAAGFGVAALLIDPLFTFEGLPSVSPEVLKVAVEAVRRAGGLYIADETYSGLGRTGQRFWGYERYDIAPDMVTLGESVANGLPMGVAITTAAIATRAGCSATESVPSGGNPLVCSVATATLDVLQRTALRERALSVGEYLRYRFDELAGEHPILGSVLGGGHYLGIEVRDQDSGELAELIVDRLARKGVLISGTGRNGTVLQIRPPMPFALEHADVLVDALADVVRNLDAG